MSLTIAVDTVSDLPENLARAYKIPMLPVNIRFGRKQYKDREELSPEEFYSLLKTSPIHPMTTPMTPVTAYRFFKHHLETNQHILMITVTASVSRVYNNCKIAAEFIEEGNVEILDSGTLSIGEGLLALYGSMLQEAGLLPGQIIRRLERVKQRGFAMLQPENLVYLERSGRIDDVVALYVGKTLKIQPVLGIEQGHVHPVANAFSFKKGIEKMLEILKDRYGDEELLVGIMDSGSVAWADYLESETINSLNTIQIIRTKLGPSMGAHVGPNTIGISVIPFEPIEG